MKSSSNQIYIIYMYFMTKTPVNCNFSCSSRFFLSIKIPYCLQVPMVMYVWGCLLAEAVGKAFMEGQDKQTTEIRSLSYNYR